VVAAVAAVLFFHRMLTRPEPLVDLRVLRNRNYALGCVFAAVIGIGLYGSVYLVPLFLGRVRGYDSLAIGQTVFVAGVAQLIAAPIAGRAMRAIDMRLMLAAGLIMFGGSCWWLAHLTSQSAFWDLLGPQALRGFALMFLFVPTNALALGTLAPAALKNGSGLYNLMRNLGGAVGIAVIGTVATTRTAIHTLHLQEQVTWSRPAATKALAAMTHGLTASHEVSAGLAALRRMALLVQREALTLAYNDVLLLMAFCYLVTVPLTLLLARPRAGGTGH
jgi:DHA2 family multidrug resistance protein